jgi:hypothetical protein
MPHRLDEFSHRRTSNTENGIKGRSKSMGLNTYFRPNDRRLHLLVRLKVFNTERMNQAVFVFRGYEDNSLRYTGIDNHEDLTHTAFTTRL